MVRWLAVGLFALALGCGRARSAEDACKLFPVPESEPGNLDLTGALPFRNYLALAHVGTFAHHYFVHFERDEDEIRDSGFGSGIPLISAWYDQAGALQLGGGGDLVQDTASLPRKAPDITEAVEREIRRRCPSADFSLRYAGAFRTVKMMSFLPVNVRAGNTRLGWHSESELLADETLVNILSSYNRSNIIMFQGFGRIEVPEGGRFVELEPKDTRGRNLRFTHRHTELVLAAARSHAARQPAPKLADLPVEEPDSLVHAGHEDKVYLVVNFHFKTTTSSAPGRAVLELGVNQAVFGPEATSETEVTPYRVQATLAPASPFGPAHERVERDYLGRLTVRILDADGIAFERSFVASGEVVMKGNEAAVPYEWGIPGGSVPSHEDELRRGKLRSPAGVEASFSIDTQLEGHPPH